MLIVLKERKDIMVNLKSKSSSLFSEPKLAVEVESAEFVSKSAEDACELESA